MLAASSFGILYIAHNFLLIDMLPFLGAAAAVRHSQCNRYTLIPFTKETFIYISLPSQKYFSACSIMQPA